MTSNTPINPGEDILPRLREAAWFNSTLPQNSVKTKKGRTLKPPKEGEIWCVGMDGSTERFNPVGIDSLANEDNGMVRYPYVSTTALDEFNWVIPQSDMVTDGAVLCVVSGLTRAWVTTTRTTDSCVIYDPAQSKLVTAKEGKAQILVKGNTTFPSLINIGPQCNCIEALGYLDAALVGTTTTVSVSSLYGVNFPADELGSSITARNIFAWTADIGALALVRWAYYLEEWIIIQVTCPGDTIYSIT